MTDPAPETDWEKKSERLETRLPHSVKQQFQSICEQSGRTPSMVMRELIEAHVVATDQAALEQGRRAWSRVVRRHRGKIAFAGLLLAAAVTTWGYAAKQTAILAAWTRPLPTEPVLFARYDVNGDKLLTVGEISGQDRLLHAVMDIDGCEGISLAEFYAKGTFSVIEAAPDYDPADLLQINQWSAVPSASEEIFVRFDLGDPERIQFYGGPTKARVFGELGFSRIGGFAWSSPFTRSQNPHIEYTSHFSAISGAPDRRIVRRLESRDVFVFTQLDLRTRPRQDYQKPPGAMISTPDGKLVPADNTDRLPECRDSPAHKPFELSEFISTPAHLGPAAPLPEYRIGSHSVLE